MNLYDHIVRNSTPEELAKLLFDMVTETARYREAFYAAKAFIETSVSEDPPIDDGALYDNYIVASRDL